MPPRMVRRLGSPRNLILLGLVVLALSITTSTNLAQQVINNSGYIAFDQAFFAFEVESPLQSLKETAIWNELEAMLDNPYAFVLDPTTSGNEQGWPSYRQMQARRRSFVFRDNNGLGANPCAPGSAGCVEVSLAPLLIHPLNYNHMNGEELRLLNPGYEGGEWMIPDQIEQQADGTWAWVYKPITVSPGEGRIEEDEAAIDFNSPIAPDIVACIVTTEFSYTGAAGQFYSNGPAAGYVDPSFVPSLTPANFVDEGITVCGGDPGEPGWAGFGVLEADSAGHTRSRPFQARLAPVTPSHRPTDCDDPARGVIEPRADGTAGDLTHGLRRPSLRVCSGSGGVAGTNCGTPANPAYLLNSEANLAADPAALVPSNENDYYRGATRAAKETARSEAATLGKALFWDMQVGSDTVQSCGTCHFNAGADSRTKNQTNPNHLGNDLTLQLHGGVQNTDLVASDFPFQKVPDTSNAPGNPTGNVNDVASSMGVRFRHVHRHQGAWRGVVQHVPRCNAHVRADAAA